MPNSNETLTWRLESQEKNLKELDEKFDKLKDEQGQIKVIINSNSKSLEKIEGLLKWSLGGIVSATATAIGKFFFDREDMILKSVYFLVSMFLAYYLIGV